VRSQYRPRHKSNPKYWEPLSQYLAAALKARKVAFKVPVEMWIGLPILTWIGVHIFQLGASRIAWDEHWLQVILLIVAGESALFIIRPALRFVAALWEVCHEERFRDISRDILRIIALEMILLGTWTAYFWHYCYVRSPHFELTIRGAGIIANVSDAKDVPASLPVSSVFFTDLYLTNKYREAKTSNWRLLGTMPDGRTTTGYPSTHNAVFDNRLFLASSCIYNSSHWFDKFGGLGNGNYLSGCGDFVFKGIRESVLLEEGVTFKILFDSSGKTFEKEIVFPLEETPSPFREVSKQ